MEERHDIKQAEMRYLAGVYKKDPSLFAQKSFSEDAQTLGEFGIVIPEKDSCAPGLLKLWPEDFIVEEKRNDHTFSVTTSHTSASSEGQTVYATLVKCGLSTIEAVDDIAKKLSLRIEDISYAGIKDKDALTGQEISIRRASIEQVQNIHSEHFFLTDVRAGAGIVEKGNLQGNRFTILIRTEEGFSESREATIFIEKLKAIQEYGFYNFFYLQRFGTPRLHNFAWARLILRGEYEIAVRDIIVYQGTRELPYFVQVRKQMNELWGKWDEMLALIEPLPLMFRHEHMLISYLVSHPGDYVGALQTIPEQITLWMYALTSLLFNQRISNYLIAGHEPPARLPFFLNRDQSTYEPYKDMLESLGIYPPPLHNLRSFPFVSTKTRDAATKERVNIINSEVTPEGVVLQFELGKGQYATTFLSHLFNLVGGPPQDVFSKTRVDTKAALGEDSIAPLVERFAKVTQPKGDNIFEQMANE